jgi:hypothetical protein
MAKFGRDFFDMASLLNGLKLNRSKHFIGSEMSEIEVDPEVIEYIKKSGKDFRVSTDCSGPVILPTELKPPKNTDLQVKAGKNTLFISSVQARYIDRVTMDMLYDPSRRLNCYLYDEI